MIKFHRLSRAVVIRDEKVLLTRAQGYDHCFLPGGHVEPWESAEDALCREMIEETGLRININRFLGDIEHKWTAKGTDHIEINHIFEVGLEENVEVQSNESHLNFFWVNRNRIEDYDLKPEPLVELINKLYMISSFWRSTVK